MYFNIHLKWLCKGPRKWRLKLQVKLTRPSGALSSAVKLLRNVYIYESVRLTPPFDKKWEWQRLMATTKRWFKGWLILCVWKALICCLKWNVFNHTNTFLWSRLWIHYWFSFAPPRPSFLSHAAPPQSALTHTHTLNSSSYSFQPCFPHWFTTSFKLANSLVYSIRDFQLFGLLHGWLERAVSWRE